MHMIHHPSRPPEYFRDPDPARDRYHWKICDSIDFKYKFEFNLSMARMTGNSGVDNGTYWGALQYFHDNGMLKVSKKRKQPAAD